MGDAEQDAILTKIRDALSGLPGIAGLALGGSRARGTADRRSDVDVGVYYHRDGRPDVRELSAAFARIDDSGDAGCTGYGEWGPWINGGGWLVVDGVKTDVLLREVDRVRAVVRACAAGRPEIHYQPGHPHGFCTVIYAGELHHNVAFHDPQGVLAQLRELTDPYPEPLAKALVGQFGWESQFALHTAVTAAGRGDVAYVTGCAYRAVACLTQVLFATAGRYLVNEKGAVAEAATFPTTPAGFRGGVEAALAALSADPGDLTRALRLLRDVREEVMAGAGG
ncbi:nucleotidyltransferase domain-containing protein [Micromonospora sp. WMMD956]|uniref:nucleotidyltransferase domain-containing protein n=1 Tax=Micromonospora sp. WMMD956 TaxID=3016108 RepID=UPI00241630A5|nr:nucleotidyltransferase domain-containing protein [Micromonospora sp. WMMD956]MDG4818983.1 nucleotidyltransferase domain-containing protein [Micromonospora sp. WMMD956]